MMSERVNDTNENAEVKKEAKFNWAWNSFNKTKGLFLLGMTVAVSAYGGYMAQPSQKMDLDSQGVASFILCSSSLNSGSVDEAPCREYYEDYLSLRISKTDNLPKIIPAEVIGTTYRYVKTAFMSKGLKPLKPLETCN